MLGFTALLVAVGGVASLALVVLSAGYRFLRDDMFFSAAGCAGLGRPDGRHLDHTSAERVQFVETGV